MTEIEKNNVYNTLINDAKFLLKRHKKNNLSSHAYFVLLCMQKVKEMNKKTLLSLQKGLFESLEKAETKEAKFYLERDILGVQMLIENN